MRYTEIIQEMPVVGIEKDFQPNSNSKGLEWRFRNRDKTYINRANYDKIVMKKLRNVEFDIFIYIVDTEHTRHIPYYSNGNYADYSIFHSLTKGVENPDVSQYQITSIQKNFEKNRQAVHILITHNDPDASDDWMPLTPWMIMHRLAHACLDPEQRAYEEIPAARKATIKWDRMLPYYNRVMVNKFLNTKSARDGKLLGNEGLMDMFVCYCIKGYVDFQSSHDDPEFNNLKWQMNQIALTFNDLFYDLVQELKGKVWIG